MRAIILAAGRGERMHPLTETIPKPLVKVGDKALIEYHLVALASAGFEEVVINVSYFPEQFIARLGDGERYGLKIHYSFEPQEAPLETGGGIFQALPLLGEHPFLAVSADLWTDFPFQRLSKTLDGLAHIVLVNNPAHHPEGDFAIKNNRIYLEGNKLNFGGIGIYHPTLFANCKPGKFSYIPLLKEAIQQNLVSGEHYQGLWENIGTLQQLKELQKNYVNSMAVWKD